MMKRLTQVLLIIFAASSLGGCNLFAPAASAEEPQPAASLTADEPETDTDVGDEPDVPPEPPPEQPKSIVADEPETDTDVGDEPDVPPEPDAMPPE